MTARYLSQDECEVLFGRIVKLGAGGGDTIVTIQSGWSGNLRWANSRITTSGDARDTSVRIIRNIRGATGESSTNNLEDGTLRLALASAERVMRYRSEDPDAPQPLGPQTYLKPKVWSDATYDMDAQDRSNLAEELTSVLPRVSGMSAAGFVQQSANVRAIFNTNGLRAYYAATDTEYSVTMRDPAQMASGWAGKSHFDWRQIDAAALTKTAYTKCIRSRGPAAIEPGRYTVILEPQAVHELVVSMIGMMDRFAAESFSTAFTLRPGQSKIGSQMFDSRLTIGTDPMDPNCSYVPFDWDGAPIRAVNWVENGILKELPYSRQYALTRLGTGIPLPNPMAYRMSGGTTTTEEMIGTLGRGLLITRFSNVSMVDGQTMLTMGNTRDGVWLIERGRITMPVRNFRFNDSPLYALNRIEQLGAPIRVYSPSPAVVPTLRIRDFNLSGAADAI